MCSRTSAHLRGEAILFTHDSHTGNHSLLNLAFDLALRTHIKLPDRIEYVVSKKAAVSQKVASP